MIKLVSKYKNRTLVHFHLVDEIMRVGSLNLVGSIKTT